MKSRKIVALMVAFAAFMAVATSGLAATTTTTTYSNDNVTVTAVVDAQKEKEVTYLVTNSDGQIVYIDQQTADKDNGKATFSYKIPTRKIPGLVTAVNIGTNGDVPVDGASNTGKEIVFNNITLKGTNKVEIKGCYSDPNCTPETEVSDIVGNGNTVYVKLAAKSGYNIVTVNGDTVNQTSYVVKLENGDHEIEVTAAKIVTTPTINDWTQVQAPSDMTEEQKNAIGIPSGGTDIDEERNMVGVTKFFEVSATPTADFGVKYNGVEYKALGVVDGVKYYAVRIIVDGTTVNESDFKVFGN